MINFATLLTQDQVGRTHAASLEILESVGLQVHNEKARMILKQHGCQEQSGTQIIKFPTAVVEKYRALLPPTFTFYGRDPKYDRTIPQDGPVIVTGSCAARRLISSIGYICKPARVTFMDAAAVAKRADCSRSQPFKYP